MTTGADGKGGGRADYRFLLANERTYLAYLRTALSLQIAGFGVLQFLTQADELVRYLLGMTLVAAGSYVGWSGFARFRSNERAIRAGRDIPRTGSALVVGVAVVVMPLLAAIAVLLDT